MKEIVEKQEAFLSLRLKEEAQNSTFEDFTRSIRQRHTLVTLQQFWKAIPFALDPGIKVREILSSYVLAFFPDISLSSERNEIEERVYQTAVQFTRLLESLTLDVEQLQSIAMEYQKHFQAWKEADQADLLQLLAKSHKQVRDISDSMEDKQHVTKTLDKLENIADSLGGKEAVEHVKTSSKYGLIEGEVMAEQVLQQMRNAFWDKFQSELDNDPPNFVQYPEMVGEIRSRIEALLPEMKVDETTSLIRKHLHEGEILEQIQKGEYGLQEIYNVCVFALERVKELGPPADDADVQKLIDAVHEQINSDERNIANIIPVVFRQVLERLDRILLMKAVVRQTIEEEKQKKDKNKDGDDQPPTQDT